MLFRRYPEVRRVSSRFGDGKASQERVVGNLKINQTPNRQQEDEKPQRRGRKKKKNRKRPRRPKTTATPFPVIIFKNFAVFFLKKHSDEPENLKKSRQKNL